MFPVRELVALRKSDAVTRDKNPEFFMHLDEIKYIQNRRDDWNEPMDHEHDKSILMRRRLLSTSMEYDKIHGWVSIFMEKTGSRPLTSFVTKNDLPSKKLDEPWYHATKNKITSPESMEKASYLHDVPPVQLPGMPSRNAINFVIDDWIDDDKATKRNNHLQILKQTRARRDDPFTGDLHDLLRAINPPVYINIATIFPDNVFKFSPDIMIDTVSYLVKEKKKSTISSRLLESIVETYDAGFEIKKYWSIEDLEKITSIIVEGGGPVAKMAIEKLADVKRDGSLYHARRENHG
jgi:hypothetical protein